MTRSSKAIGRRGSRAASCRNPLSSSRPCQDLRQLGGSVRFSRHKQDVLGPMVLGGANPSGIVPLSAWVTWNLASG